MDKPTTIKEVLVELDIIIVECIDKNSRLGLFAYLYRRTTAEILKEVERGSFENNKQLQKMDVAFANLYIDAYKDYKMGKKVSESWLFSFENSGTELTVIQHIMLGVNAHINLDLGIATAATMKGKELTLIENDFNKVNDILFNITNEMQDRLSRVSPMLFLLDLLGENNDEKVIDFSMRKAREQSWNSTNLLWALDESQKPQAIEKIDFLVLELAKFIKDPKSKFITYLLKGIRAFEEKNVAKIIAKLQAD
ncbi:hypothetical protein H0I23_13890 [Cellulophaga sp. HaHaR_3_176]|uniref:DUF5995 family protein n=1 Tax=Cellulophaga sp. HaHaR_3_176 TaxID=1942464 RepID=UPI001C1FDE75|nr:DUF5995 family protein [Cellulophaga sp. HaHaR_3_176]QWX83532.1 hypothetical protein H0I23_13890 [Cellulophaga sp. HaHaR_3_176]